MPVVGAREKGVGHEGTTSLSLKPARAPPTGTAIHVTRVSFFQGKEKPAMARTSSSTLVSDVDSEALSRGNFEVGFRPQRSVKAERAQQPEVGEDRRPAGGASDAEAVTRLARSKGGSPALSPGPAGFQSCSPGWCSAFYEADCFGADVHNYVKDLGRQQVDGALPDAQSPVSPRPRHCRVVQGPPSSRASRSLQVTDGTVYPEPLPG